LDAIAYLWKTAGTNCIHLPETHLVVKIFREILEVLAPHVILLTETNVPHEENVSYFGDGDEAHMVYQFSLPPLLIDAFLHEDATPLQSWLSELQPPSPGTTFFNFTASHDGIGVRPLEGRVDAARLNSLVEKIRERGGRVNLKRNADGTDSPYELNITYLDAIGDGVPGSDTQIRRFLATQALMLSLQGVPAVYFHSLVGTPNDYAGVEASGINRRINRRKYQKNELDTLLADSPLQSEVFRGMRELIYSRIQQPAFHPDAEQNYVDSGAAEILAFERMCAEQRILVLANVSGKTIHWQLPALYCDSKDLLAGTVAGKSVSLGPADVMWLEKGS
jgi:sucrose phosphorylase